jgi:hypothetical protein
MQTACFLNKRLKLTKAYPYLPDVKEHKQVIPFRPFFITVSHTSQAKQFNATQPIIFFHLPSFLLHCSLEKSVKFILRLLKHFHMSPFNKFLCKPVIYLLVVCLTKCRSFVRWRAVINHLFYFIYLFILSKYNINIIYTLSSYGALLNQ